MTDLLARLDARTSRQSDDGCWLWNGSLSGGTGYGKIMLNGRTIGAHCAAYIAHRGPITAGMIVCHTCDVPACVNPDHLFLGTHASNAADKVKKGRQLRGVAHPQAKLTPQQVLQIRAATESHSEIARRFNVSKTNVGSIKSRRIWAALSPAPHPNQDVTR